MRKTLFCSKFYACVLFAILFIGTAFAQCPDCEIVTIKGKKVYVYEVRKGEGLYRIGVNFGVSQDDIIKLNPNLKEEGLRLGQKIYIPVVERIDSTQYVVHTIAPKETLYGLSKQYGVRIADLQELNPEMAKKMTIGGRLLIKKKESSPISAAPAQPAPAQPAIEKSTQPVIIVPEPEPELTPEPEPTPEPIIETIPETAIEPTEPAEPIEEDIYFRLDNASVTTSTPIRLAFMLPFQTNAMRRTVKENRFIEFYEGALLAIYEAQENGQQIEVYTYDTEKSEDKVRKLLDPTQNPEIQLVDAVIGPTYANQVAVCYDYAKAHKTYFLFPFADKVNNIQKNPYLLQFNPSKAHEDETVIHWLQDKADSVNCILIGDLDKQTDLQKLIQRSNIPCKSLTINGLLTDSLSLILQDDVENIVVFSTTKYSEANTLITRIMTSKGTANVSLLVPYGWTEPLPLTAYYVSVFKPQPLFNLRRAQYTHLRDRYFPDPIEQTTPRYDMLGYDLTAYLIKMLAAKASMDNMAIQDMLYNGLQSDIRFTPVNNIDNSGYQNAEVKVMRK